jgi:prephenate dehydrogenase
MQFERLSILGVGLLGGSLGLAVKRLASGCRVVGYGHRPATLQTALQLGAIDEAASEPAVAVAGADCVILCTPVGLFEQLLTRISPALKPGALVTDVGSTKRSVVELAGRLLPSSVRFIGSHPMAGSERRGVEFARADLFDGALCITTPIEQTDRHALETIEQFWMDLGMRILRLTPAEHDRRAALISHLPHAVAAALIAVQDEKTIALSGKGFLDASRIAAGDGALWRDIFLDNADELRAALTQLRAQLNHVESLLNPDRAAELKAWLDRVASTRKGMG